VESAAAGQREMRVQGIELLGIVSALVLLFSLFLEWFTLTDTPERIQQKAWVCGEKVYSCSAWDTFPINRWLFVAAAVAPILLTYFVLTSQRGKYPTGEFTMTVGLAVIVLAGYNGIIQKPGGGAQFGVGLSIGYFVALLAGLGITIAGALRSLESGGGAGRKPPDTF
jgi:hypothetical protein